MEKFIQKLKVVLESSFEEARIELERARPSKRVGGFLIWEKFRGKEQIKRQEKLWKVLRSKFSKEDQHKITTILTLTPEEAAVEQDD
jgi:acid stress-induced BolA-like protein IbaG/YrbA